MWRIEERASDGIRADMERLAILLLWAVERYIIGMFGGIEQGDRFCQPHPGVRGIA